MDPSFKSMYGPKLQEYVWTWEGSRGYDVFPKRDSPHDIRLRPYENPSVWVSRWAKEKSRVWH